MKQRKNARFTVTIVKDGLAKEVTVPAELAEMLDNAYAQSNIYGLGGSTAKKLNDFFVKELTEFNELCQSHEGHSKATLFCQAFYIYSNEAPLLAEALRWVEEHKNDEGFTSRKITMDTLMEKESLGYRLDITRDYYAQLVADFESWTGRRLIEANLRVSFVRFLKWFYALIK